MNKKIRTMAAILAAGMFCTGCSFGRSSDRPNSRRSDDHGDPLASVLADDDDDDKRGDRNGINIADIADATYDAATQDAYVEFALSLYAHCAATGDTNVMISPASVLFAMGMTSAGAGGNTLDQMVSVMTPRQDAYSLHAFASDYNSRLNNSTDINLRSANSIWINEDSDAQIYSDFLGYVTDTYAAEVESLAFDRAGIDRMNGWVNEQTDGMIPTIIPDDLDPESVMVLINAIAFDADWSVPYQDYAVYDETFHNYDGTTSTVSMLHEGEGEVYYETDLATGFSRSYGEDNEYYFLAILPKDETISASEFASLLTADDYNEFLASRTNDYNVISALPEFESDYSILMNDVLYDMGIEDAFADDGTADFSNMSDTLLYISRVIHKTHIEVDREGTSAAAATAIIMDEAMAIAPNPNNDRYVILDRPFAYAIVETSTGLPLFIGTVDAL